MGRLTVTFVSIVLILVAAMFIKNPPITGSAALDFREPSVKLNLSETSYRAGDSLEGFVFINFTTPFYSDSKFILTIGDSIFESELSDFLDDLGYDYETVDDLDYASNPTSVKTLAFENAGKTNFAFMLPEDADVRDAYFSIEGSSHNSGYPVSPYLDVGMDGFKEWQYFGSFSGFEQNLTYPSGFKATSESSAVVKDDGKFYCEIINLPFAKDYEINSKYSLYDPSNSGNMKAFILSFSGSGNLIRASGGADSCDLPEPSSLGWNSCKISFAEPISGSYLVCVTNTNRPNMGKNAFRLSTDQSSSSTTYICPYFSQQGDCTLVSSDHFYIGVKKGIYSNVLNKKVGLQDAITQYDFIDSLNEYLAECVPSDGKCAVPVEVGSDSKGKIYLSDLLLSYVSQGLDKEEKNFYDRITISSYISSIGSFNLASYDYEIEVPLDSLDISVPELAGGNLTVKVYIDNTLKSSAQINVTAGLSVNSTLAKVEKAKSNLLSLNTAVLNMLKLAPTVNSAISSLDSLRQRLLASSSNESIDVESLQSDADEVLNTIPRSISEVNVISDIATVNLNDLAGFERADVLYRVQKAYAVKGIATVYQISYYSGAREYYTLVEKSISGNIASARIAEMVMEDAPFTVDDLQFNFNVQKDASKAIFSAKPSFSYLVEGDVSSYLSRLKTVVLSDSITDQVAEVPVACGDG
ncbi:MAG: hypothetical protein AABW87_00080, partial [Nanoarchaeota archaeon]